MEMKFIKLTEFEDYKPLVNPLMPGGPYDGMLFSAGRAEFAIVEACGEDRIWTVMELHKSNGKIEKLVVSGKRDTEIGWFICAYAYDWAVGVIGERRYCSLEDYDG